ncbi:MAG TPA: ABC transporter ATP-binding protein, partial [Burkholderiales bacterium]
EYAGGYSDYLVQRPAQVAEVEKKESRPPAERGVPSRKLSYKETRELETLPSEIESLESEQKALYARMHAPDYYRQPPQSLRADRERSDEIERLLMQKLERWTSLEAKK